MDAGLSNVRCIAAESLGHMADSLAEMKFSIGKPNPCNDHIYHSHASESLNLIFFNLKGGQGVIISYIFI